MKTCDLLAKINFSENRINALRKEKKAKYGQITGLKIQCKAIVKQMEKEKKKLKLLYMSAFMQTGVRLK